MPEVKIKLPEEMVINQIYLLRDQKVMLDRDLATLYGVETKMLKQAVRRNIARFPKDFMFELTAEEFQNWRSQFVTSNKDKQGLRYAPFAFTEQGVAMLSSILNSKLAIEVNIQIMRIFTKVRQQLTDHTAMKLELAEMKLMVDKIAKKQSGHDQNIELLFVYIDRLQEKNELPKPSIQQKVGFKIGKSKNNRK